MHRWGPRRRHAACPSLSHVWGSCPDADELIRHLEAKGGRNPGRRREPPWLWLPPHRPPRERRARGQRGPGLTQAEAASKCSGLVFTRPVPSFRHRRLTVPRGEGHVRPAHPDGSARSHGRAHTGARTPGCVCTDPQSQGGSAGRGQRVGGEP